MYHVSGTEKFLDVPFQKASLEQAAVELLEENPDRPFRYVVTPNVQHMVLFLEGRDQVREIFAEAWRIYCDSRVLSGLARLSGRRLFVVPGSDLTALLLTKANAQGLKVAVVGPSPETISELSRRFSQLKIVSYCPQFGFINSEEEVRACVDFVVRERASLVFLAVGAPRQEVLARRIACERAAAGIGLCVGASIDFLTGKQKRAPIWMQRSGIEWLHRLLSNPRRLLARYCLECPKIFYLMLRRPADRVHSRP